MQIKSIQFNEICTFNQIKPNQGFEIISLQKNDNILLYTQTLQLLSLQDSTDDIQPPNTEASQ